LLLDLAILLASLWSLSTEMIEDIFVDLAYGSLFGWNNLSKGILISSVVLFLVSAAILKLAFDWVAISLPYLKLASAVLLASFGGYWLYESLMGDHDLFQGREVPNKERSNVKVVTQLVMVEELEVLLIVIPLIASSHATEAIISLIFAVGFSLSMAAAMRRKFESLLKSRIRHLKFASGVALLVMGLLVLFG